MRRSKKSMARAAWGLLLVALIAPSANAHTPGGKGRRRAMSRIRDRLGSLWRLSGRLTALVVVLTFIALPTAHAADADEPCTFGDARALLNELPLSFRLADGSDDQPGLGGLFGRCQFRLYQDRETVTFSDEDYILGGIVMFWTYEDLEAFGWTRAEAIADLELATDHVEIARVVGGVVGTFEEVPLIVTNYRDIFGPFGHAVFNHRAFITKLPAGEYLVRWTLAYPGFPDFTSTVRLVVTAS
jgi:hypothetical protein